MIGRSRRCGRTWPGRQRHGRSGVAAIGWAQEFQRVATCTITEARHGGAPHFGWDRAERRVTCYYFYLWDEQFGPAFVKIGSYFPYPVKVWLNGHEWAKRQATQAGIGWTAAGERLRGPATTPARLQQICDRLGPVQIQGFFDRWLARLPVPLTPSGPGGRVLVGAVDAADRGVPHDGVRQPRATAGRSSKLWSPTTSTWAGPSRSS